MNKVKIVAETLAELREHYCLMGIERQPKQLVRDISRLWLQANSDQCLAAYNRYSGE
ncbi:hypothetical protein QPK14_01360 [Photorhabdus temperata subsp. temperata]